jgi:nitroreductase
MILEAPLAILVCADMRKPKRPHYCEEDCSAASENLLLAAHARGLGAVWLGIAHNQEREDGMRHLVGLPAKVQPISLVVVGYPAEKPPREDRYKLERLHRNKW